MKALNLSLLLIMMSFFLYAIIEFFMALTINKPPVGNLSSSMNKAILSFIISVFLLDVWLLIKERPKVKIKWKLIK
ncbi:hypothetical protein DLJ74_15810 [Gracilibacillus dipsosauri]|uniref:Uncharacterized protein n=1 Tax=Gracilibacillus dipsosauri TaxID=178340 RepID=A0A317KVD8_9BACI|nr:hypothetical protein DLJ74_15810 [Gracilibacillus dipsosauri]